VADVGSTTGDASFMAPGVFPVMVGKVVKGDEADLVGVVGVLRLKPPLLLIGDGRLRDGRPGTRRPGSAVLDWNTGL